MSEEGVVVTRTELDEAALVVRLNRPKGNILDAEMIRAVTEAIEDRVRPETRLVVFEGTGKHFCFGASVEEHRADQAPAMLESFHGLFRKLAEVAVPTCAVLRGQCLGGGLELASWCSWIVATPDARLGQPEIQLGVFPPMASVLLPWRAGGAVALDLCVSGRSLTADEAQALGLVNVVTDDPDGWWRALVSERLARCSASSLRFAERAVRARLMREIETTLGDLERLYIDELMKTQDANEGIAAFIERRSPQFKHR